ncbi:MAG: S8 family serine peptidase, partial [Ginsengibacter sp.]
MSCKKFLCIPFLILFANSGFTQNESIYRKLFSDTITPHASHKYFFLELNNGVSQKILNQVSITAVRKLSGTSFIVDGEKFAGIHLDGKLSKLLSPVNNLWKLSNFTHELAMDVKKKYRVLVQVNKPEVIARLLQLNPALKGSLTVRPGENIISLYCDYGVIQKYLLGDDEVTGIEAAGVPKEELATSGYDLSANKVNLVHSNYASINGTGQRVSIKEQNYDTTDIDIRGRYEYSPLASQVVTNHANYIATIIAGAGNSVYYAKGAAWGAQISSSSFDPVLPDPANYYSEKNISVQNHSYGTTIENNYGLAAVAFDKSTNDNPALLHVFSSGNVGTASSMDGRYSGIPGFANLTGNFKMAKNVLVVGAVDSFGNVAPLSSRGPAYDGRIKPEIVAFQKNGTSEAAAIVSGTALLLQQYYRQVNNSVLPSALARAMLVNSADDVNKEGPDFTTGYGNMNADKAMNIISARHILSGTLNGGNVRTFQVSVPPNIQLVKITLAWNDTTALPQAPAALVNDLDLELGLAATGEIWKPWVLNASPDIDSLNALPQRKRDSLNNIEQVTLKNPLPGNYKIDVHGFNIPSGNQDFYIVYSFDTANYFKWQRLTDSDFAEGGKPAILRWQNSFPGTGNIEYSFSVDWKQVGNAQLSNDYFYWTPPDTTAEARLRIKIG